MKVKFVIVIICYSFCIINAQSTVHLQCSEEGRGIVKSRGNECFIIAPDHLFPRKSSEMVVISGDNQKISRGKYIQSYPADIAIVRIESGADQECKAWKTVQNYNSLLEKTNEGYIEIRNDDGSYDHEPMYLKSKSMSGITISPKDNSFEFSKGMSGSSLFTNLNGEKVYLGMLLSVDEENSQSGNVFQADDMERIMQEFFQPNKIKQASEYPKRTYNDVDFAIKEINFHDEQLKIILEASTSKVNQDLIFYGNNYQDNSTMIFDNSNNTFKVKTIKMGNKLFDGPHSGWITSKVSQGVFELIELTFTEIPKLQNPINLQLSFGGNRSQQLVFRNLNLDNNSIEIINKNDENRKIVESSEFGNFNLNILEAKKKGEKVIIEGQLTCLDMDSDIIISGNNYGNGSTLIFNSTSAFLVEYVKVANSKFDGTANVYRKLLKNLPTPIQFVFNNVTIESKFVNLQIAVGANGGNPIQIKNIPLNF